MSNYKDYKHSYIISSLRGRSDEREVMFYTNAEYHEGDIIILDGIDWMVDEVIE